MADAKLSPEVAAQEKIAWRRRMGTNPWYTSRWSHMWCNCARKSDERCEGTCRVWAKTPAEGCLKEPGGEVEPAGGNEEEAEILKMGCCGPEVASRH